MWAWRIMMTTLLETRREAVLAYAVSSSSTHWLPSSLAPKVLLLKLYDTGAFGVPAHNMALSPRWTG